jgi:hypothetical protein
MWLRPVSENEDSLAVFQMKLSALNDVNCVKIGKNIAVAYISVFAWKTK